MPELYVRCKMELRLNTETCFAIIFLVLIIWREIVWLGRLRRWKKTSGYVSGFWVSDDGPAGPIVVFAQASGHTSLEAPFCLSNPELGETVEVLHDVASGKAVLLTRRHRWFLTVLCFSFFVLFLCIAD